MSAHLVFIGFAVLVWDAEDPLKKYRCCVFDTNGDTRLKFPHVRLIWGKLYFEGAPLLIQTEAQFHAVECYSVLRSKVNPSLLPFVLDTQTWRTRPAHLHELRPEMNVPQWPEMNLLPLQGLIDAVEGKAS